MRIAILTQPLRQNYGGILQNYALQTVLRRMGHQVVTLDPPRYYFRWWEYPMYSFRVLWNDFLLGRLEGKPLNKSHFLLYFLTHTFKHLFFKNQDDEIFRKKKEDEWRRITGRSLYRFIDKRIVRQEYHDLLKEIKASDYDVFIVGSDQVWRGKYNRGRIQDMFLVFTKDWDVRRIAYAASFGTEEWEYDDVMTEVCRKAVKAFDVVTVREDSGVDICRSVLGVSASQALDPTMLLLKDDYFRFFNLSKVDKGQGDLLVYILDETDDKKNTDKYDCE
jgi:Polysaccharide pyruvyl transferase.